MKSLHHVELATPPALRREIYCVQVAMAKDTIKRSLDDERESSGVSQQEQISRRVGPLLLKRIVFHSFGIKMETCITLKNTFILHITYVAVIIIEIPVSIGIQYILFYFPICIDFRVAFAFNHAEA